MALGSIAARVSGKSVRERSMAGDEGQTVSLFEFRTM